MYPAASDVTWIDRSLAVALSQWLNSDGKLIVLIAQL